MVVLRKRRIPNDRLSALQKGGAALPLVESIEDGCRVICGFCGSGKCVKAHNWPELCPVIAQAKRLPDAYAAMHLLPGERRAS